MMAHLLQGTYSYRFLQLVSRAVLSESVPIASSNQIVRWMKTVPSTENALKQEKTTEASGRQEPLKEDGEIRVGDLLKFKVEDEPFFPKSTYKPADMNEDLSTHTSDDPDSFGTLSGMNSLKTELYEGDEGDKREDEYISFIPKKLPQRKYAEMIKKLLYQRRFADALDVLHVKMLKEDQVKPEYYIYGILINFCGKVGYTHMAFKLFKEMNSRKLTVTPSIYTSLFNACANSPYPEDGLTRAKYLQIRLIRKKILPTAITCHAMIKAFGRCGDLQAAFEVGDYMAENKMQLKCETFTFLFQACISDKGAGFRHALLVYRKMMMYNIKPDLYIYNMLLRCVRDTDIGSFASMIDVLLKVGVTRDQVKLLQTSGLKNPGSALQAAHPWDEDSDVLSQVVSGSSETSSHESLNLPASSPSSQNKSLDTQQNQDVLEDFLPNLLQQKPTLGALVSLSDVKDPQDRLFLLGGVKGILAEMKANDVKPDYKTAALLLDCIPETCDAENALVRELKDFCNLQLDIGFFNTLIKRRAYRKQYKEAKEVITLIGKEGAQVDLITFGCLAMTCHSPLEACELMKSMDEVGMRPNSIIVGSLMRQALHCFNYKYIQLVFEIIAYEEMTVSPEFIKMLDIFHGKSKHALAKQLPYDNNAIYCMKNFLVNYPKWKENAKVEEEKHPWQQFRNKYNATEADEEFLTECVEPEKFEAKFSRLGPKTSVKSRAAKIKRLKEQQPELFLKKPRRRIAHSSDSEVMGLEMEDIKRLQIE